MNPEVRTALRFGILFAVMLASGIIVHRLDRVGDAQVARRPLAQFPAQLGRWFQSSPELRFPADIEVVLRANEYITRDYSLPKGPIANIYIGYYYTQRTGATYHSPLNCLPGSGWILSNQALITIKPADGRPSFQANQYLIQNGSYRAVLVYWYQGRGRSVASEYWDKVYMVFDSARRGRSDGAMVRLMIPVDKAGPPELESISDLAAQLSPALPPFVPD
ncbi:MAG: exosortase C-terminal domain/associated protein EpsI [Pyrinomonadaceae bacterium]